MPPSNGISSLIEMHTLCEGNFQMPWKRYKVGSISSNPKWTNPACVPLSKISHVAHISTALRIIEDGRIRADLVSDESILRTRRMRVVWLSPNDWVDGFRYGNIRFTFDWTRLIASKKYYWVKSITSYKPPACRILITNEDHSALLKSYDPTVGDGPWLQRNSEEHFWNGTYTLEVLVEDDLFMQNVIKIDFVKHHGNMCCNDRGTCPDMGKSVQTASIEFIASLISRNLSVRPLGFMRSTQEDYFDIYQIKEAVRELLSEMRRISCNQWGCLNATHQSAKVHARAIIGTFVSYGRLDEHQGSEEVRKALISSFSNSEEAVRAVAAVLAESLGKPDPSIFLNLE